jgi:hypothetical protein
MVQVSQFCVLGLLLSPFVGAGLSSVQWRNLMQMENDRLHTRWRRTEVSHPIARKPPRIHARSTSSSMRKLSFDGKVKCVKFDVQHRPAMGAKVLASAPILVVVCASKTDFCFYGLLFHPVCTQALFVKHEISSHVHHPQNKYIGRL